MKRLLRILLAAVGILALVAVGAVVYVTTFFDPEDLKPRLVEVVREQSGLELSLEGPLTWSFYPRLGVGVEKAEAWLPDQEMEEEASFVAFQHGEVSLAFAPLLRGEIAIDGLTLDGVHLNLERDASGRGNWETLLDRLAERSEAAEEVLAPASATTGPVPGGEGGLAVALHIARVQIQNGEVNYRDQATERELRLENLAITGTNVNPRRSFPIRSTFHLVAYDDLDAGARERTARLVSDVTLESQVALDLAEYRYQLEGVNLGMRTLLEGVDGEQQVRLRGQRLVVDARENSLQLEQGRLETTLRHPELGAEPLPLDLAFSLDGDLDAQTAQLRELELTGSDDLRLSGSLNLSRLFEGLEYRGQLRLVPLSLRPLLTRLERLPTMASESALSDVALTSPLEGDLEGFELTGLTLVLDGSTFTGRLGAALDGSRLDFDLEGDRLDLDAYLPPAASEGEAQELGALLPPASGGEAPDLARLPGISRAIAQESEESASGEIVPVEWLSQLALEGQLAVDSLNLAELVFGNVALSLSGSDGKQQLVSFESRFYEGDLAATGALDLTQDPIHWEFAPNVSRVRLDSLLEALGETPAPLRGRLTAEGELGSRGNTWPSLKRYLNGRITSQIEDGALLETNVARELCSVAAALEGREIERDWEPDTRFERAEASFLVRDGTVISDDLLITIPGIELGGEGWLELPSERFELSAAARVVDGADVACPVNPRLERVPFPVRCEGSLSGDSGDWCRFDRKGFQGVLAELLRDEAASRGAEELERRLERPLEKLEERLGEEAGGELRDALRGLLE